MFPISDRPYQNMCDPNLFYGFPKKKKLKIYKLRDNLLAVVKVTQKTLRKGEGGQKASKKTKKHYVMYRQDMHGSECGAKENKK